MGDLTADIPPHEPSTDALAFAAKAGLAIIPGIGGLLAETLGYGMQIRQAERQNDFNVRVARELESLGATLASPITVEDVITSDEFLASVTRASRLASEAATDSKRRRLAAVAANSGPWALSTRRERSEFRRLVEDYDDLHIWLLHYLSDPVSWLVAHGFMEPPSEDNDRIPTGGAHTRAGDDSPLAIALGGPWRTIYPPFALAVADLKRAGLAADSAEYSRIWSALNASTTDKGRRFLTFLNEPSSPEAKPPEEV